MKRNIRFIVIIIIGMVMTMLLRWKISDACAVDDNEDESGSNDVDCDEVLTK